MRIDADDDLCQCGKLPRATVLTAAKQDLLGQIFFPPIVTVAVIGSLHEDPNSLKQ